MRTSSTGGAILPFVLSGALLLALFPSATYGQELNAPCKPADETLRKLEALPPITDFSLPYEARIGPLRELAEESSDDFILERYYQDAFRKRFHLADEYDRALARYRARPDDPLSRYFEARLLMFVEPERSRKTLEALLAAHPGFVWPHLDLLEFSTLAGYRDPEKVASRLRQFIAACPEYVRGYENARHVEDTELIATAAGNLRRALESQNSPLDVNYWPVLWSLESRAGMEPAERDAAIRRDLERIDAWPLRPVQELVWIRRQASDLLKDPSVMDSLEERVDREAPESALKRALLEYHWSIENPPPGMGSSREDQMAYQEKEAEAQREWFKRWPDDYSLLRSEFFRRNDRWRRSESDNIEGALEIADKMMRGQAESPDYSMSVPPIQTMIAEFYVENEVRLDEVPRLLEDALKAIEKQEKYRLSTELIPEEMRRRALQDNVSRTNERVQSIRAKYLTATGRLDEARALVEQEIAKLDNTKPESPEQERLRQGQRRGWVQQLAAITAKEGRPEEALALYRSIIGRVPEEALKNPNNPYLAPIKELYLANGGSEDKWVEWARSEAPSVESLRQRLAPVFSEALPDFSAEDAAGRTWRLADLRGKATFINFWATWCGPCRFEHAEIQKLHDLVEDRDDIQVLTVSVDDSAATGAAYLEEKGYTFPVIYDRALADKLLPYVLLPTNFLVDANGKRTSLYGFSGSEQGLENTIADLERAAQVNQ